MSAADGSGFASAGFSLDLSPGLSIALVPVVSAGSSPALVVATVGLMEFWLEGSTKLGEVGWSVVDGEGSPGDLEIARRARDLLAVDDEVDACLGFFFLELF